MLKVLSFRFESISMVHFFQSVEFQPSNLTEGKFCSQVERVCFLRLKSFFVVSYLKLVSSDRYLYLRANNKFRRHYLRRIDGSVQLVFCSFPRSRIFQKNFFFEMEAGLLWMGLGEDEEEGLGERKKKKRKKKQSSPP